MHAYMRTGDAAIPNLSFSCWKHQIYVKAGDEKSSQHMPLSDESCGAERHHGKIFSFVELGLETWKHCSTEGLSKPAEGPGVTSCSVSILWILTPGVAKRVESQSNVISILKHGVLTLTHALLPWVIPITKMTNSIMFHWKIVPIIMTIVPDSPDSVPKSSPDWLIIKFVMSCKEFAITFLD